jgi:hypothetical protein
MRKGTGISNEDSTVIRISKDTKANLFAVAGMVQSLEGREVSLGDSIDFLLEVWYKYGTDEGKGGKVK